MVANAFGNIVAHSLALVARSAMVVNRLSTLNTICSRLGTDAMLQRHQLALQHRWRRWWRRSTSRWSLQWSSLLHIDGPQLLRLGLEVGCILVTLVTIQTLLLALLFATLLFSLPLFWCEACWSTHLVRTVPSAHCLIPCKWLPTWVAIWLLNLTNIVSIESSLDDLHT